MTENSDLKNGRGTNNGNKKLRKPLSKLKQLNLSGIYTLGGTFPIVVNGQVTD